MAFCANGGKETPAGTAQCPNCGAALGASEGGALKGAGKFLKGVAGKTRGITKALGGKAVAVTKDVGGKAVDVTKDTGKQAKNKLF